DHSASCATCGFAHGSSLCTVGNSIAASAAQAAPARAIDGCQPSVARPRGISSPESATPSGTPVCLIEKKSAQRAVGEWRSSSVVDAGLISPGPNPNEV